MRAKNLNNMDKVRANSRMRECENIFLEEYKKQLKIILSVRILYLKHGACSEPSQTSNIEHSAKIVQFNARVCSNRISAACDIFGIFSKVLRVIHQLNGI